jgi:hypothetical protein
MKKIAYTFAVAALLVLAAAVAGRLIGDPHAFYGSAIKSWISLSSNLVLFGILTALLARNK